MLETTCYLTVEEASSDRQTSAHHVCMLYALKSGCFCPVVTISTNLHCTSHQSIWLAIWCWWSQFIFDCSEWIAAPRYSDNNVRSDAVREYPVKLELRDSFCNVKVPLWIIVQKRGARTTYLRSLQAWVKKSTSGFDRRVSHQETQLFATIVSSFQLKNCTTFKKIIFPFINRRHQPAKQSTSFQLCMALWNWVHVFTSFCTKPISLCTAHHHQTSSSRHSLRIHNSHLARWSSSRPQFSTSWCHLIDNLLLFCRIGHLACKLSKYNFSCKC